MKTTLNVLWWSSMLFYHLLLYSQTNLQVHTLLVNTLLWYLVTDDFCKVVDKVGNRFHRHTFSGHWCQVDTPNR